MNEEAGPKASRMCGERLGEGVLKGLEMCGERLERAGPKASELMDKAVGHGRRAVQASE